MEALLPFSWANQATSDCLKAGNNRLLPPGQSCGDCAPPRVRRINPLLPARTGVRPSSSRSSGHRRDSRITHRNDV